MTSSGTLASCCLPNDVSLTHLVHSSLPAQLQFWAAVRDSLVQQRRRNNPLCAKIPESIS